MTNPSPTKGKMKPSERQIIIRFLNWSSTYGISLHEELPGGYPYHLRPSAIDKILRIYFAEQSTNQEEVK